MAEALGGYYPGGVTNPHIHVVAFEGGYMIEPLKGEVAQALAHMPEEPLPLDERVVERAGGMLVAKSLAEVYEL